MLKEYVLLLPRTTYSFFYYSDLILLVGLKAQRAYNPNKNNNKKIKLKKKHQRMNNYSKLCDLWYVTGFTIHQKICVKQTVFALQILDAFIKKRYVV